MYLLDFHNIDYFFLWRKSVLSGGFSCEMFNMSERKKKGGCDKNASKIIHFFKDI